MSSKNPHILLTGAHGFLGKIFQEELEKDFKISSLGRSPKNDIICDLAKATPHFDTAFDYIIHNAGKAHMVPKTKEEKDAFFQVNQFGTLRLLEALDTIAQKPKTFILISTIAVYGKDQGEAIDETYPLDGETPYALSKIEAEKATQDWCSSNKVNCIIVRLPLIVGPKAPGNLGAITAAIQKGRYPKIIGNTARKSAVLGKDVAQLIPAILDKSGIYNLTDSRHPTFSAIEEALAQAANRSFVLKVPLFLLKIAALGGDLLQMLKIPFPLHSERLKKMTSTLTFNDTKAQNELNWNPKSVIEYIQQGKTL